MSDKFLKKYGKPHKQAKREPVPEVKVRGKNKRKRPFLIEHRYISGIYVHMGGDWCEWRKWGTYRTKDEAEKALEVLEHKERCWLQMLNERRAKYGGAQEKTPRVEFRIVDLTENTDE